MYRQATASRKLKLFIVPISNCYISPAAPGQGIETVIEFHAACKKRISGGLRRVSTG